MLVQCVAGEIELLPALPRAWPTGSIRGVRARGGFELDLSWRDGILHRAVLRSAVGGVAQVRYREGLRKVRVRKGASVTLAAAQFA
jgi:alpha-L-fucosidase 2